MNAPSPPSECATALKEWATVLEAMGRGEQLVLIRKGGLIEPGAGFALQAPTFVFYPTFEHQTVNYLREPFRGYVDAAARRRAPEGQVRIELVGHAASSAQVTDPGIITRLAPFHIYNDAFVTQRLKWQPDQPLVVVVVRAFRLAVPQVLSVSPRYAGCKSWVDLEAPVVPREAQPVLDEAAFARRAREIADLLSSA